MTALTRRHLLAAAAALALARPATARTLPRILCFGDSLMAGFGLPRPEGLVPQLSGWLAAAGHPADLIDAGLSGDTTYGGRVRIQVSMRRNRPDAVIVELGGNDMLRRWQPGPARPRKIWTRSCPRRDPAGGPCCWSACMRRRERRNGGGTGARSGRVLPRATMRCCCPTCMRRWRRYHRGTARNSCWATGCIPRRGGFAC